MRRPSPVALYEGQTNRGRRNACRVQAVRFSKGIGARQVCPRLRESSNVVVLKPEVAEAFPNQDSREQRALVANPNCEKDRERNGAFNRKREEATRRVTCWTYSHGGGNDIRKCRERFGRTVTFERPGALPPDPRHFPLWANGMIGGRFGTTSLLPVTENGLADLVSPCVPADGSYNTLMDSRIPVSSRVEKSDS
jgi:hypothetical protein